MAISVSTSRRPPHFSVDPSPPQATQSDSVKKILQLVDPNECCIESLVQALHLLKQQGAPKAMTLAMSFLYMHLRNVSSQDLETVQAELLTRLADRLAAGGAHGSDASWQAAVSQALTAVYTVTGGGSGLVLDALEHARGGAASAALAETGFPQAVEAATQSDASPAAAGQQSCRHALLLILSELDEGSRQQFLALDASGKSAAEMAARQAELIVLHKEAEQMIAVAQHGSGASPGSTAVTLISALCAGPQTGGVPTSFQLALQERHAKAGVSSSSSSSGASRRDDFETVLLYRLVSRMGGGAHVFGVLQNDALSMDQKKKALLDAATGRQLVMSRVIDNYI